MVFLPPRPPRPHLENLSARERGVAMPHGLSGMSRNVRFILLALGVLVLVGCCTLSWSAVSALIPPPGVPIAASGSPTASATASATDRSTATDNSTPTGGDMTPTPTLPPQPTTSATPCPNPYCNPWRYNFSCCRRIYSPPTDFCSVFPCVSSFWSQLGYVVECYDSRFSHGGGSARPCKGYGGYLRTLYQP
jgi:hypothetical protein